MTRRRNTNRTKTLLVSYNSIQGVPGGRFEDRNVIVLSENLNAYRTLSNRLRARAEIERISCSIDEEIESCNRAVIYVGLNAMDGALNLAQRIASTGRQVRIVGCNCQYEEKSHIARAIGVPYEICECGGFRTMGQITREYQRNRQR